MSERDLRENILISGVMGKNTVFKIITVGPVTLREIDALIKKLRLEREIFAAEPAHDNGEQK